MKYRLKPKNEFIKRDLDEYKDLRDLLALHDIRVIDAEDFPDFIIVESQNEIPKNFSNEWHVFSLVLK